MTTNRTNVTENSINRYSDMVADTATGALKYWGEDYNVIKKKMYIENPNDYYGNTTPVEVDGLYALSPENQSECFGTCTSRYKIVQNQDVADIVDSMPIKGATMVFTGSKNNTRMLVAKMNDISIGDNDGNSTYLNFMWSHDGKSSVSCFPSSIRATCQNAGPRMMALAKNNNQLIRFKHIGDVDAKLDAAREAMALYVDAESQYLSAASLLRSSPVTSESVAAYYKTVYNKLFTAPSNPSEEESQKAVFKSWYDTLNQEIEILQSSPNLWLVFNSVSKSLQRMNGIRGRAASVNTKINSLFIGKDNDKTTTAFQLALQAV
jgi:hypothetical protein